MVTHDVAGNTVLVTGGAGFIGSHLVEALVPDNDVRVLDDLSSGHRNNVPDGVSLFEGDIRDDALLTEAMAGVDLVFHEAALVSVTESVLDPYTAHEVNCTGTLALLERTRAEDARVVLASSAAIYGDPQTLPIDEDHPLQPTSPYGVQKLALDRYATLYHDLYGLETVSLRYFNVYGPRGLTGPYSGVVGIFLQNARDDSPLVVFGDGTQTRDFVHVDDVVRANMRAATTDRVGEAYNVGTGHSTSITTLAELIREVTESNSTIEYDDPRPGDIDHSVADISKACEDLGYQPAVSLRDGLTRIVESTSALAS